jgi:hypothetical protein
MGKTMNITKRQKKKKNQFEKGEERVTIKPISFDKYLR